ncbi:MAG: nuclear transport factor 2 family protein [Sphingomonadales bacterium]|nr:nuclear transport factor 2 family protein [Sphingomonadales bacterium]
MSEDIVAIVNLCNLYAAATDAQEWRLFDRVFTTDVHVDFGGPACFDGLATLKQVFEAIHAPFAITMHVTTNHQVLVDGDAATCLSYVHGRFVREVGEGGNMFESTGWYDDALVRGADGWRIARRVCRTTWWGGNPKVLQTTPDTHVEHVLNSLRDENRAGGVGHVAALLAAR